MTFFTQAIRDGTIDKNLEMSEDELKNAIIARVKESNAWERHNMTMHPNRDAEISTISEEGGFSEIERRAGKKHENEPIITYNPDTKNFQLSCNCHKEKFIFNMKRDTVETESMAVKMKEIDPYRKDNQNEGSYGRESGESSGSYNNGPSRSSNAGYVNSSGYNQSGMRYKN